MNEIKNIYFYSKDEEERSRFSELLTFFNYKISCFDEFKKMISESNKLNPDLILIDESFYNIEEKVLELKGLIKKGIFLFSVVDYSDEDLQLLTDRNVILLKKPVLLNEIIQRIDDHFA